jgi:hypothetical protein
VGNTALQEVNFSIPAVGRQDIALLMSNVSQGNWTEDGGRILTSSLRIDCPQGATEGDALRLDYFGWTALEPVGPSERVVVEGAGGPLFVRGDADASGDINITDGIFLLGYLFQGTDAPPCLDAADVDDLGEGAPNITDAIYLLGWLFQGSEKPPAPAPTAAAYFHPPDQDPGDCGLDPGGDDDGMGCDSFPPCE